jgi:hypothetical protein
MWFCFKKVIMFFLSAEWIKSNQYIISKSNIICNIICIILLGEYKQYKNRVFHTHITQYIFSNMAWHSVKHVLHVIFNETHSNSIHKMSLKLLKIIVLKTNESQHIICIAGIMLTLNKEEYNANIQFNTVTRNDEILTVH